MDFIESFDLFGIEAKQIPSITGEGAPAVTTEGAVGCLYMDTLSGDMYKCIAVNEEEFIWDMVGVNSQGSAESDTRVSQYELIETIELTEDTTSIERSQEPNGQIYNFKNLLIEITATQGTASVSGKWLIWGVYYASNSMDAFRNITIGENFVTILKSEADGNLKRLSMTGSNTNTRIIDNTLTFAYPLRFVLTNENITKMTLQHQTAMPAGTIIKIYGVRA